MERSCNLYSSSPWILLGLQLPSTCFFWKPCITSILNALCVWCMRLILSARPRRSQHRLIASKPVAGVSSAAQYTDPRWVVIVKFNLCFALLFIMPLNERTQLTDLAWMPCPWVGCSIVHDHYLFMTNPLYSVCLGFLILFMTISTMVIDTLVSGIHDDWILIGLAYLLRFIVSFVNSSASIYILYIYASFC